MRLPLLGVLASGLLFLGHTIACSPAAPPVGSDDRNEIIGGVDAKSASLDAVGAIVVVNPGVAPTQLCTATLIAPRVIVTAKHCAVEKWLEQVDGGPVQAADRRFIDTMPLSFAIGADSRAPKRLVPIESVEICNVANTGFMALGCDVAVYRLAAPVDDVTPLEVVAGSLGEDAVGKKMIVNGYGDQVQAASAQYGTRKLGQETVRAVRGAPARVLFPTVDAFIDAMRAASGEAYVDNHDATLRQLYDIPMLDGYEVLTGGSDGDAQTCSGDSGGPLLAKVDGKLVVQAVLSGGISGQRVRCNHGSIFAMLGPKAQELIRSAVNDPCAGVPAEGRCEGDVAARCTEPAEGPRRVTRTDCSAALQRCIPGTPARAAEDAGAGSADAGSADDGGSDGGSGSGSMVTVSCGD